MFKKYFTWIRNATAWYDTHKESRLKLIEDLYSIKNSIVKTITGLKMAVEGISEIIIKVQAAYKISKHLITTFKVVFEAA